MDLGAAGLNEQPFPSHGNPLVLVSYASQADALQALADTRAARNGLSLLQGPTLSGKTTVIQQFVASLPDSIAVAVVDGNGLNTTTLFEAILRQFGYVLDHSSITELLAMLRVFVLQQAQSNEAPLLIIENAHALNPNAMRALCELADLNIRGESAVKMVLAADRSLLPLLEDKSMDCLHKRLTIDFHLRPMAPPEVTEFVHQKLKAAGSTVPEFIFPANICTELWRASGGWPGILDRIALMALAKANTLPVPADEIEQPVLPKGTWNELADSAPTSDTPPAPPMLYVSHEGKTLHELSFDRPRFLIGRSEHNDIPISSKFVSRHHALLVRTGSTTFLMDLNSTNGTYVNSKRVSNHIMAHNDVISFGHHRIKFSDLHATQRGDLNSDEFADTAIMKTLDDMRKLLARENTEIMPVPSENIPTSGLKETSS
ncbi:MAG: FHA domain-containing protein [Pseudomonadota bacterium]